MGDVTSYSHHAAERDRFTDAVLNSTQPKRLVLAGPGTGKSHLFQAAAKLSRAQGKKNILVLSFINELVNDLAIDLHGLATVRTLHSFAAKQLTSGHTFYMDLLDVIEHDYEVETGTTKDFAKLLHNLEDDPTAISYLQRRTYYQAYDPASIVYELVVARHSR
jgi:superfamily I DNA/RNA helicase